MMVLSRREMLVTSGVALLPWNLPCLFAEDDSTRIFKGANQPDDYRLGTLKTLNDYFPFTPPKTVVEWQARKKRITEQVLAANGLLPMPEKTPLKPVIHGKIEREGYTVEKVFFASLPGHYVTGSLYRPTKAVSKKLPGVLCPHGHSSNGRFYENSDAGAESQIRSGAEKTKAGAKHPHQARCQMLARMGCVVFHYDMVGFADSQAIGHVARSGVPHPNGFADAQGDLRLQSLMGLQTWNSIRSLDFLETLPDVDTKRLAVTGSSGGGTQTFLLAAVDDRVQVAFPAVMVSTAMQGGCVCENCSLLRVGTGNIELAGLFAPKPLGMSAAKDWTQEIMTKGYPELKELYKLLGAEENVIAKAWLEFGHNYNQVAREMMYGWFNKHLFGKDEPVLELPFEPIPPKELTVFDAEHPVPEDALNAEKLRAKMTLASDKQLAALQPTDAKSLASYKDFMHTIVRAITCDEVPSKIEIRKAPVTVKFDGGAVMHKAVFGRVDEQDAVPSVGIFTQKFQDKVLLWLHPQGKSSLLSNGQPTPVVQKALAADYAVVAPDVLGVGELSLPKGYAVNPTYSGFTYGYNRSLFAQRVHDLNTTIAFATQMLKAKTLAVVGWGEFGPIATVAKAGDRGNVIDKLAVDLHQFDFSKIEKEGDPMLLPGALKYGNLDGFLAACFPTPTLAYNALGMSLKLTNSLAKTLPKNLSSRVEVGNRDDGDVMAWLLS